MSMIKRHIEDEAERISITTGYEWFDVFKAIMEQIKDGAEDPIGHIEAVCMEHDL